MDHLEGDEQQANSISRRKVLKGIGAATAIAWTAPIITSIGTRAYAASLPSGACAGFVTYDYAFGHVDFSVTCDGAGNCSGFLDYTNGAATAFHQDAVCGGCLCGQPNGSIIWFGGPISGATGGYAAYNGGWSIQRNTDGAGPGPAGDATAGTQFLPGGPTDICDPDPAGPDYFITSGDITVTCS
jgi:hypothetical protein